MIQFRDPQLSDREWVDELFFSENNRGCEYSFTNLYCWKDAYRQQVARINDHVVELLYGILQHSYLFPVGRGSLEPVIEELLKDAKYHGEPLRLICMTDENATWLQEHYPGKFDYSDDRFGYDYIYDINRLADLGGKKLHGKRNHIHRFEENNPDWMVEPITEGNIGECLAMDIEWYRENKDEERSQAEEEDTLSEEAVALRLAIANYSALALDGILLRVGGKVIAFTMGRKMSIDTFDVNFEKAFGEIQGAYPMINREFARYIRDKYPEIRYLNREDDMGVEGLRKAKESYYPDLMLRKHTAVQRL